MYFLIETYQEALEQEMALSEMSSGDSGAESYAAATVSRQRIKRILPTVRENSLSPPPELDNEGMFIVICLLFSQILHKSNTFL